MLRRRDFRRDVKKTRGPVVVASTYSEARLKTYIRTEISFCSGCFVSGCPIVSLRNLEQFCGDGGTHRRLTCPRAPQWKGSAVTSSRTSDFCEEPLTQGESAVSR